MGQELSCARSSQEHEFFSAVQAGDLEAVESAIRREPALLYQSTIYDRVSALHIAAANGRVEVLCMLLGRFVSRDVLNRNKQTPLMLAAMHGKIVCMQKLLQAGANNHYAAYYGHSDCLHGGNVRGGAAVHAVAVRRGLDRGTYVENALLDVYVSCGGGSDADGMGEARKVFEGMAERTAVSWTTMIAGYTHRGDGYIGVLLFRQMPQVKSRKIWAS